MRSPDAPNMIDATTILRERFGYETFRPGQERAVRAVLTGRDALVVLPTGGGKSLCFQIPGLVLPGLTLVISPLISLMKDQVDALVARGLPAAFINSTLTSSQIADRLARAQTGELKLLYVSPERFDFGTAAARLRATGVSLLAVDEAHCISDWGHDFRPSYQRLGALREALGDPTTIALTATATPLVRGDIAKQLGLKNPEVVVTGFDRKNLHYSVVPTRTDAQKDATLALLLEKRQGQAIIYAPTRRLVERLPDVLESSGIKAVGYHAGLDDRRRYEVQEAFMTEQVRAVVATNAFGMGIDKSNVRVVVHYAMPGSLEAYYQEAGRAGRDGQDAECFLFHQFPDRFTHEGFANSGYPERPLVEKLYDYLRREFGTNAISKDVDRLTQRIGAKNPREIDSALRMFTECGAMDDGGDSSWRLVVRLLATPARIKEELSTPNDALALDILRSLWRQAGERLKGGVTIDLTSLSPGYGGAGQVAAVLRDLERRAFVTTERPMTKAHLTNPAAPLSEFALDWSAHARRKKAEMGKIDTMQQYAYARTCRRAFVLRYFGDTSLESGRCTGCDNCGGDQLAAAVVAESPKRQKNQKSQKSQKKENAESVVGPNDERLFADLRALRTEIAKRDRVPPYVVFTDRTLVELAVTRPASLEALAGVRGIGPLKLEKYGRQFLTLIQGPTHG